MSRLAASTFLLPHLLMDRASATPCPLGRAEQRPYLSFRNTDSVASSSSSLFPFRPCTGTQVPLDHPGGLSSHLPHPTPQVWAPRPEPFQQVLGPAQQERKPKAMAHKLKAPHQWHNGRWPRKQTEVKPTMRKYRVRDRVTKLCRAKQVLMLPPRQVQRGRAPRPAQHYAGPLLGGHQGPHLCPLSAARAAHWPAPTHFFALALLG